MLFAQHYTLDADGRRTRDDETRLEPNGTTSATTYTYAYDALGRLTAEQAQSPSPAPVAPGTSGVAADNYAWYYGYDVAGNRVLKTDRDPSTTGNAYLSSFNTTLSAYDARDRLTADTAGNGNDPYVTSVSDAYAYDPNGSQTGRTSTTTGPDPSTGNPTQATETDVSTYDVRDRLATFTRDVSKSHTQYGPSGPVAVPDSTTHTAVAYGYDDAGDRTSESAATTVTPAGGSPTTTGKTTYFLVDDDNPSGYSQVVEEKGSPSGAPVLSYVIGQEVLSQSDGTTVLYLLPDGHGSTRLVTNVAGSVLASGRLDYDAWGDAVGFDAGTAVTSVLYTGQRYDAAAGLYDLRARVYNPLTGEFTSADPRTILDQSQPITLQRYLYADLDPIDLSDPTGRFVPIVSNFLYGNMVHGLIGDHFKSNGLLRFVDLRINALLGTRSWWGLGRPDLVDMSGSNGGYNRGFMEVYEIKPVTSYVKGLAQLGGYLLILNKKDPLGRTWVFGSNYDPPAIIKINPLVYAIVDPPKLGVILYQLIDFGSLIAAMAAYMIYSQVVATSAGTITATVAPI